ncbi:hypothetical protein JRO89_XS13G0084800 [Xanthoceras sorbifolium]|uniref:Uncharacterized protein n=1 Tax=Xanthoceras sorbifolium TaxID=99658 RepID=A0ABQ8H7C1_9ROSI|nr:hypothetical protein JRO89_XS13G0084800 [Xanthoceras sorbifolium]
MKEIENSASLSLTVNLSEVFSSLTTDVICRAAFGRKYSGGESGWKFKKLMRELMVLLGGIDVGTFIPWLGWINRVTGFDAKVDRVAKEFDEFLDEIIEEHLHGQTQNREGGDPAYARQMFATETMPLYPPFPLLLPRQATEYVEVVGFDISVETRMTVNA